MAKNIVIAVLFIWVVVLSATVVRLENFHYASIVGMCPESKADNQLQTMQRHKCLHSTETRTNPLWHLLYAVRGE
jgi:hypothetical protein